MSAASAAPVQSAFSTEYLRVSHRESGSTRLLTLSGEADLASRVVLRLALAEALRDAGAFVVLDVTPLRFCDVGSAELVLEASRVTPVRLVGATGTVKRVFELVDPAQTVARFTRVERAMV